MLSTFHVVFQLGLHGQIMKAKILFAEKISSLQLTEVEMSLFVAMIIFSAGKLLLVGFVLNYLSLQLTLIFLSWHIKNNLCLVNKDS